MPLPKKEDAPPNKPLNGRELAEFMCDSLSSVLRSRNVLPESRYEDVVVSMRVALANDYYFREAQVIRSPAISIAFRSHQCGELWAFTVEPVVLTPSPA